MRELRAAMDDLRPAGAKRLDIGAVVAATEQENLQDGIDLGAWISEGLIDTLIPYSSEPVYDSHETAWTDPSQLAFFVDLVRGTDCVLAPNLMPRHQSPEDFRRRASTVYEAGAGHMFFWDAAGGSGRANFQPMWSGLRRLGHQDEIGAWQAAGEPALPHTIKPLRQVGRVGFCVRDAGVGSKQDRGRYDMSCRTLRAGEGVETCRSRMRRQPTSLLAMSAHCAATFAGASRSTNGATR